MIRPCMHPANSLRQPKQHFCCLFLHDAGRVLLQDPPSFSVAPMPYYVQWVESGCLVAETVTSECAAFKSAAGAGVMFPATSDVITSEVQNVEFQDLAGITVLNCSTVVPLQCQLVVEGPLKGKGSSAWQTERHGVIKDQAKQESLQDNKMQMIV